MDYSANCKNTLTDVDEQLRLFRMAVEHSPASIVITDVTGNIEYVNPKFTEISGYSPEEVMGQNPRILKSGEKKPEDYALLWATITGGQEWRGEFHNKKKNGELYWESASISPVKNGEGIITNFVAVKEDITKHKLAEILLTEKNAELETLNNEKDKFFSIIAHDLRSPFNTVLGISNMLKLSLEEQNTREISEYVDMIVRSVYKATNLLKNLIDWSRSQTGGISFHPTMFDLPELIDEIISLYATQAAQKSIKLVKDYPTDIPIIADKDMISAVLRNLISNAVKFTKAGGSVTVGVKISPEEIQVCVTDNGVGIPADSIAKLFHISNKYSTQGTNNEEGTGLGLILCKEFIDKHNGKIHVESEKGKGSIFSFTLPVISQNTLL